MSESDVLAWMSLRKERNRWARELRKALKNKAPVEAINVLRTRIEAIDDAMMKFEVVT